MAVHAVGLVDPPLSANVVVLGAGLIGQCGTIAITALFEESVSFNPSRIVSGAVKLVGTFGYRNEFPQTIALLASGKVDVSPLITDAFPLDDITAGFERQLSKDQAMKVMIQP